MGVVKMEEIIGNSSQTNDTPTQQPKKKKYPLKDDSDVPKGKPKSGRVWKSARKRFSSIVKTKGVRGSFETKEKLREELRRAKEASRARKAARDEERERKKERRRANLKRQEENRKRSEIVQVIRDTTKIKRMRKKQLRSIEKRDTN